MIRTNHCHWGDCRDVMRKLITEGVRVQCIVTSPPYWGLRDYGVAGQLGQESTLAEFLDNMTEVFALCRDLLADDGTLWLNMGDNYAANRGTQPSPTNTRNKTGHVSGMAVPIGLKSKDMVGQPWRLAFALQEAGWYLRQDIIWAKSNPMPESVRDRCTKAHEYLFLLSKNERYYYDFNAMQEPVNGGAHARSKGNGVNRKNTLLGRYSGERKLATSGSGTKHNDSMDSALSVMPDTRNRRSVWTFPTEAFKEAHFATFPQALVEPCILAGSKPGDIVFDPFMGSGTVAQVAQRLGRKWIGAELNPDYINLQGNRTRQAGLILEVAA